MKNYFYLLLSFIFLSQTAIGQNSIKVVSLNYTKTSPAYLVSPQTLTITMYELDHTTVVDQFTATYPSAATNNQTTFTPISTTSTNGRIVFDGVLISGGTVTYTVDIDMTGKILVASVIDDIPGGDPVLSGEWSTVLYYDNAGNEDTYVIDHSCYYNDTQPTIDPFNPGVINYSRKFFEVYTYSNGVMTLYDTRNPVGQVDTITQADLDAAVWTKTVCDADSIPCNFIGKERKCLNVDVSSSSYSNGVGGNSTYFYTADTTEISITDSITFYDFYEAISSCLDAGAQPVVSVTDFSSGEIHTVTITGLAGDPTTVNTFFHFAKFTSENPSNIGSNRITNVASECGINGIVEMEVCKLVPCLPGPYDFWWNGDRFLTSLEVSMLEDCSAGGGVVDYNFSRSVEVIQGFGGRDSLRVVCDTVTIESSKIACDTTAILLSIVNSYSELVSYPKSRLANKVKVKDHMYTGVDGGTYTTIGGDFIWTGNPALEDGGLFIRGWERVWDGLNIYHSWWSTHPNYRYSPESLIGNACWNDADRMNASMQVAPQGAIMSLKDNISVDRRIGLNNVKVFSGSNTVISAMDEISALSTTAEATNSTVIEVDADLFRVGHEVVLKNGNSISIIQRIVAVAAGSITVSPGLNTSFAIGSNVVVVYDILQNNSFTNLGQVFIENLTIDGNKDGNPTVTRWDFNANVNMSTNDMFTMANVRSINSRGEALFCGSGFVSNCHFLDSNGSGIHQSNNASGTTGILLIKDCFFDNTNLVSNAIMVHSEGALTTSNLSQMRVEDCTFKNGGAEILGAAQDDDINLYFRNCTFRNYTDIAIITKGLLTETGGYEFKNCKFYSCGDITIFGANGPAGGYSVDIDIKDCKFYNTRMYFRYCKGINIENTTMEDSIGLEGFTGFNSAILYNSYVLMRQCEDIVFKGGKLKTSATYNNNIHTGLLIEGSANNVQILDVEIINFKSGIVSRQMDGSHIPVVPIVKNWVIAGNTVWMTPDAASTTGLTAVGIFFPPNSRGYNNNVIVGFSDNNVYPIVASGVDDSAGNEANYFGAHITNCHVRGLYSDVRHILIGGTVSSRNEHNALVEDCTYNVATFNNTSTRSVELGGTLINTTLFPSLVAPLNTTYD